MASNAQALRQLFEQTTDAEPEASPKELKDVI